jgi:hypothetical protein
VLGETLHLSGRGRRQSTQDVTRFVHVEINFPHILTVDHDTVLDGEPSRLDGICKPAAHLVTQNRVCFDRHDEVTFEQIVGMLSALLAPTS